MMTLIDPNNTQAILIGASEFDFANEGFQNLPNVKSNLVEFRRLLIEMVGIDKNQICMMLDRDNVTEITSEIIGIIPNVLDTIIVYYAGHGIYRSQNFYLATKKTRPEEPEYTGAMPSKRLVDLVIKKARVKNLIFIIDCCFSAMAKEGVDSRGKNVFFMTAAPSNQAAKDESPENAYYTAFTHELLVILKQGIKNAGEILTLQDIINHLNKQLTDKDLPEPQSSAHGSPDKLGICKNPAYQNISLTPGTSGVGKTGLMSQNDKDKSSETQLEPLLFLLPNRERQKHQLRTTIQNYQGQWQHPLLCFIYGDNSEYGEFVRCLLEGFLPTDNVLSKYFGAGIFNREIRVDEFQTVEKLHQDILWFLESETNTAAKKEAIANKLAREQQPIIFSIRIFTEDLADWQDKKTIIDGFIEFWADWPKMIAQRHPFLVFLSFNYKDEKFSFVKK
ncbi:MAG: hypothetical protein DRR19_00715 [Candidatus Parabeggiatoa sp. nov. 1]|nr:MAG: hypothetical protein DRR19_00715 [Gammaproteobacteria bacterium]